MAESKNGDLSVLSPLQVVLLCLLVVTVAGGCWFLSAARSTTLVDGAIEWQVDSPLRAVVQLLCLNYQFPTIHAGTVKTYILGIGAGLACLISGIALVIGRRGAGLGAGAEPPAPELSPERGDLTFGHRSHISPLAAAQVLIVLYLLWSFVSIRWSAAPILALGGSILLAIQYLWPYALGNVLNRTAARMGARIIVLITAITAVLAIWYYYGRNPTLRAKFPLGNPTFLSACLIPGILLAVTLLAEQVARIFRKDAVPSVVAIVGGLGTMAVAVYAFILAGSRGPAVGLAMGLLGVVFFALPRWWKLIPAAVGALAVAAGLWLLAVDAGTASPTGRDETLRFRLYTWDYALRMVEEKPVNGFGQGGYVLTGDSFAVNDVLADPEVFTARIAHAHNEWFEVMADLGVVGLVLIAAALGLTLHTGVHALRGEMSLNDRWVLLGLMGALVGLVVEEAFGVGLRVSDVPTLFYTVIGLIWAFGRESARVPGEHFTTTPARRIGTGLFLAVLGLAALVFNQQDFAAARNAYEAEQHYEAGEYEDAIRRAENATIRLNPQRSLTAMYRLAEAHARVAREYLEKAVDRESRARQGDIVDAKLLALAQADRRQSDQHCVEGSKALKTLITWSPGFLNHGRVEYWLNLVQAENAAARQDPRTRELALRNAQAAIERELLRQPFDTAVALDYLNLPGLTAALQEKITVLARPLRYRRIIAPYAETLAQLMTDAAFNEQFAPIVAAAAKAVTGPAVPSAEAPVPEWVPETLRLAAIVRFRRGDYEGAREVVELAAKAYDSLYHAAPIGAASCYMELADCRFYSDPMNPKSAVESAYQALRLAPDSLEGRRLRASVNQRLVEYYLADGREPEAKSLLQELAEGRVTEEMLLVELGARYRRLCESVLARRRASMMRQSPEDLLPSLRYWLQRAIALYPGDYLAYFYAADLAFHEGDFAAAARFLRQALDLGLDPRVAIQFLEVARQKKPEEPVLESLWNDLMQATEPERGTASVPSTSPPPPDSGTP